MVSRFIERWIWSAATAMSFSRWAVRWRLFDQARIVNGQRHFTGDGLQHAELIFFPFAFEIVVGRR